MTAPPQPSAASVPSHDDTACAFLETPVGLVAVSAAADAVVGVQWQPSSAVHHEHPPSAASSAQAELLAEALDQLHAYFEGRLTQFDLPLSLRGTSAVACSVLTTLDDTVDHGETITYGELAERSGTGIPARAIGGIMGANPLPIFVPCHRVVASTGLGGYSGGEPGNGLETKRWLLEFEGSLQRGLF